MRGRTPKDPKVRRRRNKTPGSARSATATAERARRRPALPAYETVMGLGVQVAVGNALSELTEAVARVTVAAAAIADAAARGDVLSEKAEGTIAWALVDSWAGEVKRLAEGGKPDWHPQTVAWWAEIWHSPMREQWLDADRHALNRLAVIVEMYWRDPTQQLLAEIRLQEQRFGLTWADRHRLGWSAAPKEPKRKAPTAKDLRDAGEDPRESMRAVP